MPECVCNEVTNGNKDEIYLYIQLRENSMPKLLDLIGETKTKIYCPATACRTCVLALPRTIKVDLTNVGNEAKQLKFSGEREREKKK